MVQEDVMVEQCPNCGSETDHIFSCWECGADICEHCMFDDINIEGDHCEGCLDAKLAGEE